MPSSFTPSSHFETHVAPQILQEPVFGNIEHSAQHGFPQSLPTMTMLPFTTSQQGQKRNLSDVEYAETAVPTEQHPDPAFYGLVTSLPMSTYVTQLSPPPQRPNKRLRQALQNAQGGCSPMPRRPQAPPSYSSRSVASSRPRTAYRSQPMLSRDGHGSDERYRPTRPQQQPASNTFMRSMPSTNPYLSDRPPTWNWLNELSASGTSMNILDQHYQNFTFTWPTIGDESQTAMQLSNMQQGSDQMQQTSTESIIPKSTMQTAPSYPTPEPFRAFENSQATNEMRSDSFGGIGAQFTENRRINGCLVPQGIVNPWPGQEESRQLHNEIKRNGSGEESTVVHPLPDLPDLSAFDAAMFAHLPNLDHDLGFDSDFGWDMGDNSNAPSKVGKPAQDTGIETVSQDIDSFVPAASSDDCALLELLQPVAWYLASSDQISPDTVRDDLARHTMPVSDGDGMQPVPPDASLTTGNNSTFSIAEAQSMRDLSSATTEPESHVLDEDVTVDGADQCNMLSKLASTNADVSAKSPNVKSYVISQTAVLSKSSASSSPAHRGLDQRSPHVVPTTSSTNSGNTSAINNSTSTSLQTSTELTTRFSPSPADPDAISSSQHASPDTLLDAQSSIGHPENPTNMHRDLQEWLDGPSAELGQPVALKFKVLPVLDERSIHGWQVVWASGSSQLEAGQPRSMTSSEEGQLRVIRRKFAISRSSLPPWRFISNDGIGMEPGMQ